MSLSTKLATLREARPGLAVALGAALVVGRFVAALVAVGFLARAFGVLLGAADDFETALTTVAFFAVIGLYQVMVWLFRPGRAGSA